MALHASVAGFLVAEIETKNRSLLNLKMAEGRIGAKRAINIVKQRPESLSLAAKYERGHDSLVVFWEKNAMTQEA